MESRANWKAFATGDMAARDVLLTENLSLVHHVARQLERKLSNELDHDELVSAGTLGLMSAMTAFDPDRGLAFSTFAVPRIRGAILDELRRQDHVPRSVRRKTRDITTARNGLAAKLCRMPDDTEVASALGVDVQTLWKWESDVEGAIRVPIDNRPTIAVRSFVAIGFCTRIQAWRRRANRSRAGSGRAPRSDVKIEGTRSAPCRAYYFEEPAARDRRDSDSRSRACRRSARRR
jgi:RNA polymerase sigma factor (sigma-70 family)